jgi:hypothetical protein
LFPASLLVVIAFAFTGIGERQTLATSGQGTGTTTTSTTPNATVVVVTRQIVYEVLKTPVIEMTPIDSLTLRFDALFHPSQVGAKRGNSTYTFVLGSFYSTEWMFPEDLRVEDLQVSPSHLHIQSYLRSYSILPISSTAPEKTTFTGICFRIDTPEATGQFDHIRVTARLVTRNNFRYFMRWNNQSYPFDTYSISFPLLILHSLEAQAESSPSITPQLLVNPAGEFYSSAGVLREFRQIQIGRVEDSEGILGYGTMIVSETVEFRRYGTERSLVPISLAIVSMLLGIIAYESSKGELNSALGVYLPMVVLSVGILQQLPKLSWMTFVPTLTTIAFLSLATAEIVLCIASRFLVLTDFLPRRSFYVIPMTTLLLLTDPSYRDYLWLCLIERLFALILYPFEIGILLLIILIVVRRRSRTKASNSR